MFENITFKLVDSNKEMLKYTVVFPDDLKKVYRGELYLSLDKNTKNFTAWTFRLGHMVERSVTLDEAVCNDFIKEKLFVPSRAVEFVKPEIVKILENSFEMFSEKINDRITQLQKVIESVQTEIQTNINSKEILKNIKSFKRQIILSKDEKELLKEVKKDIKKKLKKK